VTSPAPVSEAASRETVALIDTDRAVHEAGFTNRADYHEWLVLEGARLLSLSLREEAERQTEVLDGERKVRKARVVGQLRARLARCIDSRLSLNRRVALVHESSPCSRCGSPSVGETERGVAASGRPAGGSA
jgi:hypothetical protein